jgi:fucose permease
MDEVGVNLIKSRKTFLFLLGNYYAFLVNGALVLLLGAVMPYLLEDYQLGYDQGGTLIMLQAAGNLIATLAGGIVSAYIGKRSVLVFGAIAFAAGYSGVIFVPLPGAIYFFLVLSGLGWGIINNLVNVIVSDKVKGDAGTINILHMAFGVGAFVGPFLVSIAVSTGLGWRAAMGSVAVFAVILAYVFLRMDLPGSSTNKNAMEQTTHKILQGAAQDESFTVQSAASDMKQEKGRIPLAFFKDPRFYVFMLILFFYVGSETSVNGWLTTYILDTGTADEFFAQRVLSITWLAVIIGRLACAWLSKYLSKEALLLAGGVGSILFVVLLILSGSPLMVYVSVIGLGLSFAGIYPTTVANAEYLIKGSGVVSGLIFSFGGLGATLVPYFIGLRAEAGGIGSGMTTLIITLLLMALLCAVNLLLSKRKARV